MLPDRLHLLSVNHNMRKSGLTGQKMFLTRFDKIFWNENVCVLSACLSEKQIQLYLITEDSAPRLSVTKATEPWSPNAALGLFVRKCMRATEGLKRGGWGGTPLLSISVGTGVYTTYRPVGHTFREL